MDLINKTNFDNVIDSENSNDDINDNIYWCESCNSIDCDSNNYYNTLIWNNIIDMMNNK